MTTGIKKSKEIISQIQVFEILFDSEDELFVDSMHPDCKCCSLLSSETIVEFKRIPLIQFNRN